MHLVADFVVSKTPATSHSLQQVSRKVVHDAIPKSKTIRDFAVSIKESFEALNGYGWHVLVGKDFSVDLRYRKGTCVLLYSKQSKLKILLYRTTHALPNTSNGHRIPVVESNEPLQPEEEVRVDNVTKRKTSQNKKEIHIAWFDSSDMDKRMQETISTFTESKLTSLRIAKTNDLGPELARSIKDFVTRQYGATWHSIVSSTPKECVVQAHAEPGMFAEFVIDHQWRVVLYRHGGMQIDTHVDVMQWANRAALAFAALCGTLYLYFSNTTSEISESSHSTWKFATFGGMVVFLIVSSLLRMYQRTLRQQLKHG